MIRPTATPSARTMAGALSVLAVAIGTLLITAAPAKADGFGFFFSAPLPFFPVPVPAPVVVQHQVVYGAPVVVHPPHYQTYYRDAYDKPYRHHRGHGHGWHGRRGWRGADRGHRSERQVDYRY